MKPDPRLHHYCQNISQGHLAEAIEMYTLLGHEVVYTPESKDWIMVGQPQLRFAIQITQIDEKPIEDIDTKKRNHVAFLSDNPAEVLRKVETWAKAKGITYREGGWSEIERYFDLPDIFINFVVEVMHTSIEKK